jgi:hypothetical protein
MKKFLVACGLALAVAGGTVGVASADSVSIGVRVGHPYHPVRRVYVRHYWWHGGWYTYRPRGYVYVAPPRPWGDPYWRRHHCWWAHGRTICN